MTKYTVAAALISAIASLGLVFASAVPASAAVVGSTTCSTSRVVALTTDVGPHSYRDHDIVGTRANGATGNWVKIWGSTTLRANRSSVSPAYKGTGHVFTSGRYYGGSLSCQA